MADRQHTWPAHSTVAWSSPGSTSTTAAFTRPIPPTVARPGPRRWRSAARASASRAPGPTVAPNGDIYVAWVRWNPYPAARSISRSFARPNGGVSYAPVTNPLTGGINPRASDPTDYVQPAGPERQHPLPALAADRCHAQRQPARGLRPRSRRLQHRRRDQRLLPPLDRQRRHLGRGSPAQRRCAQRATSSSRPSAPAPPAAWSRPGTIDAWTPTTCSSTTTCASRTTAARPGSPA